MRSSTICSSRSRSWRCAISSCRLRSAFSTWIERSVDRERLHDVAVRSERERLSGELLVVDAGHHDRGRVRIGRTDVRDDVEPGLARHLQIADQQLERLDGEQLLRLDAVLGRRARVARLRLHRRALLLGDRLRVHVADPEDRRLQLLLHARDHPDVPVLSGIFFPFSQLPGWVEVVAWFLPLYHLVEITRGMATGPDASQIFIHTAWLAVVTRGCFSRSGAGLRARLVP